MITGKQLDFQEQLEKNPDQLTLFEQLDRKELADTLNKTTPVDANKNSQKEQK